ncbi:uncharacterized protein LOC121760857 [Salvia splendens]|uniref:uncharacterized protein LOC121760857 n=1 Tax=Salvia splendens TaxID=180675 RepID=UPI001C2571A9|nr:uncharacterized protein LOC121760857 [Salvia splendens]
MATYPNNIPIPNQEHAERSSSADLRQDHEGPTLAIPSLGGVPPVQLDWIISTIAKLESRLTATDSRLADHRNLPRLDHDPPYALPIPAIRGTPPPPQPSQTAVYTHIPLPQPFQNALNQPNFHFPEVIPNNRQPQPPMPQQPPSSSMIPPWFATDPGDPSRSNMGNFQQSQYLPQQHNMYLPMDRQIYSPSPGPRPTCCWYPSNDRQFRGHPPHDQHRGVRSDPPRFDGSDAANWIFKIQYYFDHMMMPDSNRLHYVVHLFDPPAPEWIKHYCSNNDYVTWQDFLNEVRYRFDPDCYESYIGLIAKLCQMGSVSDYQLEFERLQNKLSGVPDHILLPIYIAGLKQPLQREVKLHRPNSLAAAFTLAKELSACRSDQLTTASSTRHPWLSRDTRNPYNRSFVPPNSAPSSNQSVRPSGGRFRGSELAKLPVVRLSSSEKSELSRRGLCWYCEEKWASGHVCKQIFLAYMEDDPDDTEETGPDNDLPELNVITVDLSHLNTVAGVYHPNRFICRVQFTVQRSLSLLTLTEIDLQGNSFHIDLHILPFHGPDISLGMKWLESLGRVTHDYLARTMEFFGDDTLVVLQGLSTPPRPISQNALTTLMTIGEELDLFEIFEYPVESATNSSQPQQEFPSDLPPTIRQILSAFSVVFQLPEIEKQVSAMLEQGIIQPSQIPDHFPIPTADELFDELGAAKFFTKLDLRSGNHQIRMHSEDIFKTAFRTHDGHFEFLVMPFGLTNAPSTFQAAMNSIFRPLLRKSVIVFFDDILVYSPTLETNCTHLEQVLSTLAANIFFVKLSKCIFCSSTVDYLGHLITDGRLKADPAKIEAMVAWQTPTTVKQLCGFLGLTGYYRRFVAHYAIIAAPLTDLLKKDSFVWSLRQMTVLKLLSLR